jgi:predicted phosphoribosyltransferase
MDAFGTSALFRDRQDAGQQLADRLKEYRGENPLVLALPRGGVAVGYEVARALDAPLDIIVARKLGAPFQPEFGIGAIAPGGVRILDERSIRALGVTRAELEEIIAQEEQELLRRVQEYRPGAAKEMPDVRDRTVILIDDGLATGVTARAAIAAVRQGQPRRLVLAMPVCAPQTAAMLRPEVDDAVCLAQPADFRAVGVWYENFEQLTDAEVRDLLRAASEHESQRGAALPAARGAAER